MKIRHLLIGIGMLFAIPAFAEEQKSPIVNKLEDTVNTILQKSIDAATAGAEWLKGEIPDVVQQLVVYNTAVNGVELFLLTLIGIAVLVASVKTFKIAGRMSRDTDGFSYYMWAFPHVILIPLFFIPWFHILETFMKLWLAPKVWLLEYAANLVHR